MIGGLDGFDEGEIIADGNNLSGFKPGDFYKYRASYVGFIFQDYHLIDELTVEENIRLEAEISSDMDVDAAKALADVDLLGYGARFPEELSGGQKQRVAIARALIKSPKVLLCDEPTGNLDKNTSTQIMDLLSRISKERLVLIVSHNMPDAEKYADRIIELSDGRVISDLSRKKDYKNTLTFKEGTLTLPYNHNLTPQETKEISEKAKESPIYRIVQNDGGYEETVTSQEKMTKVELRDSGMKQKSILKLFTAFSKASALRTSTTAFISAVMVVLLIIFQSFLMFDGSQAIAQSLDGSNGATVVLRKDTYEDQYGNVTTSNIYKITEDDIAEINRIAGNGTRKYLLYNFLTVINLQKTNYSVELGKTPSYDFGTKHIYTSMMAGTLACDEEYLIRKFGNENGIPIVAGDPYRTLTDGSVIITDYVADAMIMYNPHLYRSYEDVLGNVYEGKYIWSDVAAIIDTGYKTKYKDIIDLALKNDTNNSTVMDMVDEQRAMELMDDIKANLALAYTMNPHFLEAAKAESAKNYIDMGGAKLTIENKFTIFQTGTTVSTNFAGSNLNDGEILLTLNALQEVFPEKSKEDFTFPMDCTLTMRINADSESDIIFEKNYKILGISGVNVMSPGDLEEFKYNTIIPYEIYIENYENSSELIEKMNERGFSWVSTEGRAVTLLNKSVRMFFDLFRLIEIMMLVMTVVFLVSHSIRSIKSNYYQIGVIKAIGGRDRDISKIFILQNLILSVAIAVLTFIGSLIFIDVANDILIKSFIEITGAATGGIDIITFDIYLVSAAILASTALSLIATIAPLLLLHNIKPINIIKAKE
jgi:ABC-type lipoprotein export system ATPase subunit